MIDAVFKCPRLWDAKGILVTLRPTFRPNRIEMAPVYFCNRFQRRTRLRKPTVAHVSSCIPLRHENRVHCVNDFTPLSSKCPHCVFENGQASDKSGK